MRLSEPACRPHVTSPETDLWHDVEHVGRGVYETKQDRAARVRAAKAVCAGCPVRESCLAEATDDDHGIWGGLTLAERSPLEPCDGCPFKGCETCRWQGGTDEREEA